MENLKKNSSRIYIGISVVAVIIALILCVDYARNRSAEKSEATQTVTMKTEKEKRDNVVITVNTDTIQDGLQNMGVLITQEYYFTQVEKYTKEKTILKFITSQSEFTYSYDGSVMAGVDFEKIAITKEEDKKTITVDLPPSEIQAVVIDKDTFKIYSEKDSLSSPLTFSKINAFGNNVRMAEMAAGNISRLSLNPFAFPPREKGWQGGPPAMMSTSL